jgi:hypothetical protein
MQPIPGPHPGDGNAAVAERWLTDRCDVEDENDAAAAPATIAVKANILTASFIFDYPLSIFCKVQSRGSLTRKIVGQIVSQVHRIQLVP